MTLRKLIHSISLNIQNYFQKPTYIADREYLVKINDDKKLQDKVAIVTGGAGTIGRAISLRLAIEGAIVFVTGRTKTTLDKVVDEIENIEGRAYSIVMDVEKEDSISSAMDQVLEKFGRINFLINCAGGSARNLAANLHEQSTQTIDEILNTNLRGSMLCSRKAAQTMVLQKSGKIINISSIIGIKGKARFTDYAAAKAGVIGYTASLAKELGTYGITVNSVSPGYIQRGKYNQTTADKIRRTNLLNTIATPEHIANLVAFLVSTESDFITGQNIVIDGGRMLGLIGDL